MEGQEVGHRETRHQRDQPHQETELESRQVGLEGDAEFGSLAAAVEDGEVVLQRETRQQLVFIEVPEAHHQHQRQRDQEEQHKHRRQGQRLPPGGQRTPWRFGRGGMCSDSRSTHEYPKLKRSAQGKRSEA
jgi:hypothetical protein